MSDMIEGLSRTASDVGIEAGHHLAAPELVQTLDHQVRAGRKRRRVRAAAIMGCAVVMVSAAVGVVPRLGSNADPVQPAEGPPTVVSSVGNLTVFSDGSMSLFTQRGTFVDIPAATTEAERSFEPVATDIACAFDPAGAEPGWYFHAEDARAVLLFARPQTVAPDGTRSPTLQGETLVVPTGHARGYRALTIDTEVATGPQLGFRVTVIDVPIASADGTTGAPFSFASQLDASPAVSITGDADSLGRLATVESVPGMDAHLCEPKALEDPTLKDGSSAFRHYLVADIYLLDRAGHARLLATHTSWVDTEYGA